MDRYLLINGDESDAPLISTRAVEKDGTPKNIGTILSCVYFVLGTFGYPLINMSVVYWQAGIIPTVFLWVLFSLLSLWINMMLAEGISLLPGNSNYDLNLEYSGLAKELFNKKGYYFFLFVYILYSITANIAMGRIVAQAADDFVVLVSGHSYGIQFYPTFKAVVADSSAYFYEKSFNLSITAGFTMMFVILAPLSLFQLFAALWVQGGLLLLVLVCCAEFITYFITQGLNQNVPLFGSNWTQVMGPVIFNLGIGGIIPLWVNQKKPQVKTFPVMIGVSLASMVLNIILPILGAYVYGSKATSDLFELMTTVNTNILLRICVYIYTLTVIASSIPINSITIKNNIYTEIWANKPVSMFFGIFFQYLVGWICLSGGVFTTFLNYISLFLGGFSGFFFPIIMYYLLQRNHVKDHGSPSSPFGLFPTWLLKRWKWVTFGCLALTAVPTIAQISIDFYYLIFLHKNIV